MNYLAHSYLSFSDGQLVGNMIADFIRNKEREGFPTEIQEGIRLHRAIDSFTDSHIEVHEAKKIFSPLVRLYSGAFVDVSFDYFVAHSMTSEELMEHSQKVYKILWKYEAWLPENFRRMLVPMEKDNWLYNYREDQGIQFSMQNVLNKAKYLERDIPVFQSFIESKKDLEQHFKAFFPDLKTMAQNLY